MNTSVSHTCANCLNAYNGYDSNGCKVALCVNKDWEAQFHEVDTHIRPDETCGTWQQRRDNQYKVNFHPVTQLSLFDI